MTTFGAVLTRAPPLATGGLVYRGPGQSGHEGAISVPALPLAAPLS